MPTQMQATNDQVLVAIKTPMDRHAATALLPAHFSLAEALDAFRRMPTADPDTGQVVDQLHRECAGGVFHFLVVSPAGEVEVMPPKTVLGQIAAPREVRSPGGALKTIPAAAIEVQAYTRVGDA